MGCFSSKNATKEDWSGTITLPKWTSEKQITEQQLIAKREEFWDTQPHYGGAKGTSLHHIKQQILNILNLTFKEIWDALRAAIEEKDQKMKKLIIESAGIIVFSNDLSLTYDERGINLIY